MSLRFTVSGVLALIMEPLAFGQHYTQTNLVSNVSGVAPIADPQLINPWGISRGSGSAWWVSDNATGLVRFTMAQESSGPLSSPFRKPIRITRTRH